MFGNDLAIRFPSMSDGVSGQPFKFAEKIQMLARLRNLDEVIDGFPVNYRAGKSGTGNGAA
jgi:hypothetical protein